MTGERIIRRRHVLEMGDEAFALFVAAMIWGFGVRGYGPDRVGTIVQEAGDELGRKVEGLVDAAKAGPGEAWEALTHTCKLRGLGPAFGTKVAYFAAFSADVGAPRPLIADANTSWAMWDLVRLPRSVERRVSYQTYVDLAHRWADAQGWRPDDIEWALFEIGKDVPRTAISATRGGNALSPAGQASLGASRRAPERRVWERHRGRSTARASWR